MSVVIRIHALHVNYHPPTIHRCWSSRLGNIPTLKQFMHKKEVTGLYRSMLRLTRFDSSLRRQVQSTFRNHVHLQDSLEIQRALQEGKRQYKQFYLSYGGMTRQHDGKRLVEKQKEDGSAESDVVGRMGVGWPWEK
jgi:hypothetical protein